MLSTDADLLAHDAKNIKTQLPPLVPTKTVNHQQNLP